uniref:Rieske domain-containing protein n=1 Tax=Glossina pallidipes TaxID=7398 RepID=A0A1A9Z3Y6_GLOPL
MFTKVTFTRISRAPFERGVINLVVAGFPHLSHSNANANAAFGKARILAVHGNRKQLVSFCSLAIPSRTPKICATFSRLRRHHFQKQQLFIHQQRQHEQQFNFTTMGSINCKEYTTTNVVDSNKTENGTTGSGSYQNTCETNMSDKYTDPVIVCNEKDLPDQGMKQFEFTENSKVLLIKQKGQLYAVGPKCTHYGAPLHTGVLGDGRIRCPWHGACFSIKTGDIEDFPGLDSLPCYKVEVKKDGNVAVMAKQKDMANVKRLKDMVKRDPGNCYTFVILGGGPAGGVCVETLRQQGFTGRIVMVSKEPYLPYDRVKVSKSFDVKIEALQFRENAFYDEYGIETWLNVEATKVCGDKKIVTLSNGMSIKYDKMFIATGSAPTIPPIDGNNLKNVVTVRGYDDSQNIRATANEKTNVVCLGSSFIALELAQALVKQVASITVVGRGAYPLSASFGNEIGERVLRLFTENNVKMIMNSGIKEILGNKDGEVEKVVLSDDTTLPCNLLILGTGAKPNTKFLEDSGLKINADGSINTDMYLKSSMASIYVGGDIANAPVFSSNSELAAIGHYQLAQYHGRIAAINMVQCRPEILRAVPFFFTMLFGKGFRFSGHGAFSDVVIEGDLEGLKFVAYFINSEDKVVSVASCGRDPIVAQFAELQSQGGTLTRKDLQNTSDPVAWTKLIKSN